MATVYITGELLSAVHTQISRMREHEIREQCPEHNHDVAVDASQFLSKIMWGDRIGLRSQIPKEWLRESTSYTIRVHDEDATHRVDVRGLSFFYLRPVKDKYEEPRVECTLAYLQANIDEPGAREIMERIEQKKTAKEIEQRWSTTNDNIQEFLRECKSLNEAAKLLPSIRMYLPKEYIERLERKVERKADRAAKVMQDVPADEITAAAVAARLAGVLPA